MQMQKSEEFQFQMEGLVNDLQIQIQQIHQTDYGTNNYREALIINDINQNGEIIMKLQNTIKSEYLILGNQQKQKQYNIKRLQCEIRKAVEKFIQYKDVTTEDKSIKRLLLNEKDLQDLQPNLDETVAKFIKDLHNVKNLMKLCRQSKLEPKTSVLEDLVNFFPNFKQNMESIIRSEIKSSVKIDSLFESEGGFNSKVLNHLRKRYQFQIFSQKILKRGINKLKSIKCQLIIEFTEQYERIKEAVQKTKHLKNYINNKGQCKQEDVCKDIEYILQTTGDNNGFLIFKYLELMSADAEGGQRMTEQFMKRMDVTAEYINLKIGLLTLKSIIFNTQQIQSTVSIFAEDILNSVDGFPLPIRQLTRVFEDACKDKYKDQFKAETLQQFIMKTVFSKWIFTELMKNYQQITPSLTKQTQNTNFSIICHILQKILYRQQFYENDKFSCFNQLIQRFKSSSQIFFDQFKEVDISNQNKEDQCNITFGLLSFETIKYILSILRQNIVEYVEFQPYHSIQGIFSRGTYQMFNQKYSPANLYVLACGVQSPNLMKVFQPKLKLNRLVVEFLQTIPYLTEPTHLFTLIQQNKYGKQTSSITKIPVQLYANYLSSLISPTQPIKELASSIEKQILETKKLQKRVRMLLDSNINNYITIQKALSEMIDHSSKAKIRALSYEIMKNFKIKYKFILKPGQYLSWQTGSEIIEKKAIDKSSIVYESSTIKSFLKNISKVYYEEKVYKLTQSPLKINEMYNAFIQMMVEAVSKQNHQNQDTLITDLKDTMGQFLFERVKLSTFTSTRDSQLLKKIKQVHFASLSHLEPKYTKQQDLFFECAFPIIESLKYPSSPEGILQKLLNITLTFQHIILSTGKASDITADIQIPLTLFIMIKSKIINLYTLSNFVSTFVLSQTGNSILGQIMTLLHSVVDLLQNIDGAKLGLPQEEFKRLLGKS